LDERKGWEQGWQDGRVFRSKFLELSRRKEGGGEGRKEGR